MDMKLAAEMVLPVVRNFDAEMVGRSAVEVRNVRGELGAYHKVEQLLMDLAMERVAPAALPASMRVLH